MEDTNRYPDLQAFPASARNTNTNTRGYYSAVPNLDSELMVEDFICYAEKHKAGYGDFIRCLMAGYQYTELIIRFRISGSRATQYRKIDEMIEEIQALYRYYAEE